MIIGEEIGVNRKSFLRSIFPFSEYQINFFEMIFNSHSHTFQFVTLPFTQPQPMISGLSLGSMFELVPTLIAIQETINVDEVTGLISPTTDILTQGNILLIDLKSTTKMPNYRQHSIHVDSVSILSQSLSDVCDLFLAAIKEC